ncbi:protein of unknown function [Chishuiella changwenlii]|uniref:DUF3857 domain-containing protein n=1 Tax=Chishuiella changwenlii TaxID=1434701 RepID=A0A1M6ZT12_9FLAO|nr:DUF3857 domain-containing protein [Chishuiella changwenlii]GGE92623.1 hypothetical protein GCM10010984_07840 [Chishuiella changwenlii]SHL33549.1 protein of unknown function [Chishuiella changwenlii]
MNKILLLTTFFIANFCYSQDYSADKIPANLLQDAYAVVRQKNETVELSKIDELKYTEDVVITVLSKAGDSYVGAYTNYSPSTKINLFEASLYDASGKEIKKFKSKDFGDQSNVDGGQMYTDDRVKYLSFTPTTYPYTIHYKIVTITKNTIFIPRWFPIGASNLSIEQANYQFTNKTDSKIRFSEKNLNNYQVQKIGDSNQVTYSLTNIPAFEEEDNMINSRNIFPNVIVASDQINIAGIKGKFDNWNDYGKWFYENLINGKLDFTPTQKAFFQDLVKDAKTDREKVQILYKHMQNKVRYIGVQLGIGGLSPFPTSYVENKSYGDCKALSNYMIGMLDAVNIKAYHTVIYGNSNAMDIDDEMVYHQGNHMIVYVPLKEENIWLEATSQTSPFNYLGRFTSDRKAFIIEENGGKIISTQHFNPEDNQLLVNGKASILANGTLNFEFSEVSKGLIYENYSSYSRLTEKDLNLRLKNRFSDLQGINFKKKEFDNSLENAVFTSNFDFSVPNYAKIQGNNIIINMIPVNREETSVKKAKLRKFDFKIQSGYVDEVSYILTLPEGYKLPTLFLPIIIKSDFGEYSLQITPKEKNNFEVKRVYKQLAGTFAKEKYNDYVDFRRQIAGYDNTKILLEKL